MWPHKLTYLPSYYSLFTALFPGTQTCLLRKHIELIPKNLCTPLSIITFHPDPLRPKEPHPVAFSTLFCILFLSPLDIVLFALLSDSCPSIMFVPCLLQKCILQNNAWPIVVVLVKVLQRKGPMGERKTGTYSEIGSHDYGGGASKSAVWPSRLVTQENQWRD